MAQVRMVFLFFGGGGDETQTSWVSDKLEELKKLEESGPDYEVRDTTFISRFPWLKLILNGRRRVDD